MTAVASQSEVQVSRRKRTVLFVVVLVIVAAASYALGHRQVTRSETGVVQSIGSQKICLQLTNGDQLCGVLATQPGIKMPAQGETITVHVFEAKDGTASVTFLALTNPTLPT